ncbi:MAG: hypothetical protein K8R69_01325 [Deltaproteobacteria bacterium]|nr:hypothetical protein [Deltaproteobacteria bacterium]
MPSGITNSLTASTNVEENFSPLFPQISTGFCAPPALTSSENENSFIVDPESAGICNPDPRSPYAQKLFAENSSVPVPPPTGEVKIEPIQGEATATSQSTGESIVEGFYVFMGTFSFLYRLFT